MLNRRRRTLRHWMGWIVAGLIVTVIAVTFFGTVGRRDYVAIASQLRQGDPLNDRPKDPMAALHVLERVLADDPGNFAALVEKARAWADLRAWDNAVLALEEAADSATEARQKADALSVAMDFLVLADPPRFDDAVAIGRKTVELQPEEPLRVLRLGATYYKGSLAAQQACTARFVDPIQKSARDVGIEKRVEAFVTDLWGTPDLDDLADWLMPTGDPVVRQVVAEHLATARERFRLACETLAAYRDYGGFDPSVARTWCQALYRSGRLYEAFIEAGMALREPGLSAGVQRDFSEVQAQCSADIGQYSQAADKYAEILDAYARQPGANIPYAIVYSLYDMRVKAGQWDWILGNVAADSQRHGNDALLRYAHSAALLATGRTAEALEAIRDPYAAVSLGAKTLSPGSLRGSPERRRAIAMLAYHLFNATGDSNASLALDAVLVQSPDDVEALRLRRDLAMTEGRNDAAMLDAFALLTRERRDRADFQRWLDAADALSQQRMGVPLSARATGKVNQSETWHRQSDSAAFITFNTDAGRERPPRPELPDQLYVPQDPALSFLIVDELVRRNNVTRARNELRKLSDDYPDVQEFRYRLGRLLVREGQFESALVEFRKLLDDLPADTELLDLAMRTELALGRQQEAAELVNQSILDDPLGVGAVRYGQRLVEQGKPEQAQKLIERLLRWTDFGERTDVLVLAARVQLALGNGDEAQAILATLATQAPDSVDVALLGLDVGAATSSQGLIDAAVAVLQPQISELFPDQMQAVSSRLLAQELHEEMLGIFDETVRELPAAVPSLRSVAQSAKALSLFEQADALLARLTATDPDALLDRFLLLALRGERDEAARRLRLDPVPAAERPTADLLLLLGNTMLEIPGIQDGEPGARLAELGVETRFGKAGQELMDAIVRIMPARRRLSEVRPPAVVKEPDTVYPEAGHDVALLVALAQRDADAARDLCRDLLYLLLLGDRPFWQRETALIAEHALGIDPALQLPTRTLVRDDLRSGRPRDALVRLQPLLADTPAVADLALFMQGARDLGHGEWGVARALAHQDDAAVQQLLGDTLLAWEHPEEARTIFAKLVSTPPATAAAYRGLIASMTAARQNGDALQIVDRALAAFPDDAPLAKACADVLAGIPAPNAHAVGLMTRLSDRYDTFLNLDEALARAQGADPALVSGTLTRMIERLQAHPAPPGAEGGQRGILLVRSARTARNAELPELARQLNSLALQIEPGAINLYQELARLEQEEGHIDTARRYLEVLSFIDLNDREAAMDLARLDFQQLGQPVRAADVVRRTFGTNLPPSAVEIVAAEACLLGRPMDAINAFYAIKPGPLVTADTYMTVARIAYASGRDDIARPLFTMVLKTTTEGDPRRARAEWLLAKHLRDVALPAGPAPAAEPHEPPPLPAAVAPGP